LKYADLRIRYPALAIDTRWLLLALRWTLVYGSAAVIALFVTGGIFTFTPIIGVSLAHTEGVSMEPLNKQGDVVLLKRIDGSQAKVGEVIVFENGSHSVMHRVKQRYTDASGQLMLVTQGDNVPVPDDPIAASQVSARLLSKIPFLGDLSRMVNGKGGFYAYRSIVISICVFSIALWGLVASGKAERGRAAESDDGPPEATANG
jgi:signal peptidase I